MLIIAEKSLRKFMIERCTFEMVNLGGESVFGLVVKSNTLCVRGREFLWTIMKFESLTLIFPIKKRNDKFEWSTS
jgi:hypothetical protein